MDSNICPIYTGWKQREPFETVLTSDHIGLLAGLCHKNDKPAIMYWHTVYPITPQNDFEPQVAAAHCCCAKIAPVFLCFSFCLSHSGSTIKIEMSYKT